MGEGQVSWNNTNFVTGAGNLEKTRSIEPKIKPTQKTSLFPSGPRGASNRISGKQVAPACSLHWACEYKYLAALCLGEMR